MWLEYLKSCFEMIYRVEYFGFDDFLHRIETDLNYLGLFRLAAEYERLENVHARVTHGFIKS